MSKLWILNDRFNVKKENSRNGGTATVYKGIDLETEEAVAIKLFNNSKISLELTNEAFQRDLKSLSELNSHENIAKLIDHGDDPETGDHFIVMEWLEKSLLETIEESEIKCWDDFYIHYGKPILEALSFSHQRDIIHRDIKPANVLFSCDGKLRLVDFGIAKYKIYWGANVTFVDWKSKPYAPPESDNYQYVNTRDIYGFAALSLACLEGRDLNEDENLTDLIKSHTLEDGVADILERCLCFSPEERIQTIEELIDSLDRFCSTNKQSNFASYDKCYLELTVKAIQQLQLSTGLTDKTSIERHVAREINEACAIERKGKERYSFLSVEHSYLVVVDDRSRSHFKIIDVYRKESWILENIRAKHYNPSISFQVGKPPSSQTVAETTLKLLDNFSEYEANAVERNKQIDKQALINRWRSQLRLQFDLEKASRNEVKYTKYALENGRIEFNVGSGEWEGLLGQERLVQCNDRKSFSIVVDKVSKDTVYGSSEGIDKDDIPIKGVLSLDTRLQSVSRIRQEAALDDVVFQRSYRADLKHLIFSPERSRIHNAVQLDQFFQKDLDIAKKEAVSSVLGMHDFLVINGPPGTGKTKVISEIVLQFLAANPGSKILISSQTHNALDNAIERIREVKNDDVNLGAVRIGRKDDQRISENVKELLLDNLVTTWLSSVKKNSTRYLEEWSDKIGVDKSEVELGLSVRTLRENLGHFLDLVSNREGLQKEIDELDKLIAEMRSKEKIPEELSLCEFNRDKSAINLRDLDDEIVSARRSYRGAQADLKNGFDDGEELVEFSYEELQEWEDEYLSGSTERDKCRGVIELLQDWFDRFGRSSDFNAAFLSDASIVAATCIGIGHKAYRDIKFDLCIIDEASKATPTETLLPIVKSKKWVLVGDQAQLPPFVQEGANNVDLLNKHGLREDDLKKTLLDFFISKLPVECILPLDTQYRMCPEIGNLVSNTFYDGKLKTGRGDAVPFSKNLAITKPVTWYSTSKSDERFETRDGKSYINRLEANYISSVIKRFNLAAKALNKTFTVCVLSFYSSQQNVLCSEVARIESDCENLDITCDTVDSFQGREADICIVSITRCNTQGKLGFVDDPNRVNVAISRGKEALVLVGDSSFCRGSGQGNPLESVLDYIKNNNNDCALVEV